jgi:hypothetical protein
VHDEIIFLGGKMVSGNYLQSLTIYSYQIFISFLFPFIYFYLNILIVESEVLFFI